MESDVMTGNGCMVWWLSSEMTVVRFPEVNILPLSCANDLQICRSCGQ